MNEREVTLLDIAAIVILYNSSIDVISNINSYINQVQKLYVVDNSDFINSDLIDRLKSIEKIHYHSFNGNKGVAKALNWAAGQAIVDNYKLLLTMDDDTSIPLNMISRMICFWNKYPRVIGILSGSHKKINTINFYNILKYTFTSGNLLNLEAYKSVGGYLDDLFIDHVDHEYGLRLNKNGYEVIEITDLYLKHNLGEEKKIKIGNKIIKTYITHSPIRLYYFVRNGIYVANIYRKYYPLFSYFVFKETINLWIKAILLEDNKIMRIKMLLKGFYHGCKSRLGKYKN